MYKKTDCHPPQPVFLFREITRKLDPGAGAQFVRSLASSFTTAKYAGDVLAVLRAHGPIREITRKLVYNSEMCRVVLAIRWHLARFSGKKLHLETLSGTGKIDN